MTDPQRELLASIANRSEPVARHYAPAKALVKQGFAEWQDAMFGDVLAITDAGLAALKGGEK